MAKWRPETRKRRELEAAREVGKLRELVHFLLVGQTCCFCGKPLSETAETWTNHGNARGPKLVDPITIHHRDGNHDNNAHENKALAHRSCHKRFHLQERRLAALRPKIAELEEELFDGPLSASC